jgi:hypothetical protein
MLLVRVVLKLVPVMMTEVPIGPLIGVKFVMVGKGPTTEKTALVAMLHPTVTVMVPVVAPEGTVVVIVVDVAAETAAVTPLNLTVLFRGVVLKLVPVMVTVVPIEPLEGLMLVMVGGPREETVLRKTIIEGLW